MTEERFCKMIDYSEHYLKRLVGHMKAGNSIYINWVSSSFTIENNEGEYDDDGNWQDNYVSCDVSAYGTWKVEFVNNEIEVYEIICRFQDSDGIWKDWETKSGGEWWDDIDTITFHEKFQYWGE